MQVKVLSCSLRARAFMQVILLLVCITAYAQDRPWHINLPVGRIQVKSLFGYIEQTTGKRIHYNRGTIDRYRFIYIPYHWDTFEEVLKLCSPERDLDYSCLKSTIYIVISPKVRPLSSAISHPLTAELTVKDPHRKNLSNANLHLHSSRQITSTNINGTAAVHTNHNPDTVSCTYTGMEPQELVLTHDTTLEIIMQLHDQMRDFLVTGHAIGTARLNTGDRSLVDHRQLEHQSTTNLLSALSGRVAGLLITETSGVHGASSHVMLRGKMSILNGSDPLYIIDGIPLAAGNQSVSNISSGNSAGSLNPFSFIPLDDIEKIEVLKDAEATAIYGSKGANGVILITTKQGVSGKLNLNFSGSTGISKVTRRPRLLNIHQYIAMRRQALDNDSLPLDLAHARELAWDTTHSVDWGKMLIGGTGNTSKARISASGGTDASNYFLSLSKLWETNVFPSKPLHDLVNLHGNFNYHSRDQRLSMQASGLLGWDDNHQFIDDITRFQFLVPNAPSLLDKNGKPVFNANNLRFDNPLSYTHNSYEARSRNSLISGVLQYRIWRSLTLRGTMGYNDVRTREYSETPIWSQDSANAPTGGSSLANTRHQSWILEPQLEYTIDKRRWVIGLLGGATLQGQRSTLNSFSAQGFTSDSSLGQSYYADSTPQNKEAMDYRYTALFGRANINWNSKYILDLTGRLDGSSRFDARSRYGKFGAAGLAWLFSDEDFVKARAPFISLGKLRGSYGVTGNDLIGGGSRFLDTWGPTSRPTWQNIPGIYPTGPVDPGLSWETIRKMEFAMDWGFLHNSYLFSVAWYRHRSDNQLLPDSFPMAGLPGTLHNRHVVVQNSGWEFTAVSKIIDTREVEWTTSFNISLPVSKLVSFSNLPSSLSKDLLIGRSLNTLLGYKYLGVDKQSGIYQFKDLNKDGQINDSDITAIGKIDVTCFGGWQNTLRWRNLQLSANLEFRKQTGANYQAGILQENPAGSLKSFYSNETTDILPHWQTPGDQAPYQRLTSKYGSGSPVVRAQNNFIASDGILTDASFVRLKTISLSWEWTAHLLQKMGLQAGNLSVEAENLFTLTPYKGADPEIQSIRVLPPLKTITLKLQVKF